MSEAGSSLSVLRDPRFAPHATSSVPVWLWSADGSRLIWANPIGAAIFGFEAPSVCAQHTFAPDQMASAQIARLAGTLSLGGTPRLEMLRGFGAGFGRTLLCTCSRVAIDYRSAILVVATQPAGPNLTLAERAHRLLEGLDGAFAVYATEGTLMEANSSANALLSGRKSLAGIDAAELAKAALATGKSNGVSGVGAIGIDRLGADANMVLFVALPEAQEVEEKKAVVAEPHVREERRTAERAVAPVVAAPITEKPAEPKQQPSSTQTPAERRHPLRFVWQMDAQGKFSLGAGEFTDVIGDSVASALNKPWNEIAATLGIDPQGEVAKAIASRDTWSGVHVAWPVAGSGDRIAVELSGLPIYDRDRVFRGYRGFGVCRDTARIAEILKRRAEDPARSEAEQTPASPDVKTASERPLLTVVPSARNVLPFRSSIENKTAALSPNERNAFSELAKQLSARLRDASDAAASPTASAETSTTQIATAAQAVARDDETHDDMRPLLNRLPVGVLIHRHGQFLYANKSFLDWTGHETLTDFDQAGGLDSLFLEGGAHDENNGQSLTIQTPSGGKHPTQARLSTIQWDGMTAMALVLAPAEIAGAPATAPLDADAARELRDLKSILDTATDGILVIDAQGRILTANHGAQALFGHDADVFGKLGFAELFAPESKGAALDYLHKLSSDAMSRLLNHGREVIGRVREGGFVPLFMTLGRLADRDDRFCVVLRDITQWKKTEEDLLAAKRQAERTSSAKSEFLAKVSHEIRTPLNAIIGFSEVMMHERFGPIGNDRYRDYLKDIHASGGHLVSLLNDLLDLSKIEAGKLDLNFSDLNLNDLTQQSVAIMQPEANKERIIIRTSLPTALPAVVADARSVRQIILNLLSNSIKFTGAGGQVIVSTAVNDNGEVVLRVRDTGTGMSESDIATALEPFRQLATAGRAQSHGTGLGLPLTKALAEANRARFTIKSAEHSGTLVEIAFPQARQRVQ